jgi:putative restriction endonuclease
MKAVFDTKPNSGYDDEVVRRYHFPTRSNYLSAAEAAVGDWIVYRETQRNRGRRAYVAVARVLRLEPDPVRHDHAYAIVGDYLPFDRPVPFAGHENGGYWEAPLRDVEDRSRVGATLQNKSIRLLAEADFAAIVSAGLSETLDPANAVRLGLADGDIEGLAVNGPSGMPPGSDHVRRVERLLVNRKVRDANFRRQVCEAYNDRCAVTGLRIINGGGRSEAQAAHIWSVGQGGPDVVQNGIALSGTVHWLFDRHLISLTDEYRLLVSHNKVPSELRVLFEKQMERIHLPSDNRLWPHPTYLEKHRERFSTA